MTLTIIGVLLTLAVPAARRVRTEAARVKQISFAASIAGAVSAYAASHADAPPVLFSTPDAWPEPAQTLAIDGEQWSGWWWSNPRMFFLAFDPQLPAEVLLGEHAVGGAHRPIALNRGPSFYITPWSLSGALYAAPEYFVPERQAPLKGWRAQALSEISQPSNKGLVEQFVAPPTRVGPAQPGDVPTHQYIGWADGSANRQLIRALNRTVRNRFAPWGDPGGDPWGPPGISNTHWGVKGLDR